MISVDIEIKLKAYHGGQLLKVKRQFVSGSVTKIWGPSGSGKTTLLKMIAGLSSPRKGKIIADEITWFDHEQPINLSPQKRHIGFVFQNYALFPNMTVQQHLEYASNDTGWIKRLLQLGQLGNFTTHKPDHLSGGQQQRLAILRALATKPKLLLMDEPFSALDSKMKTLLMEELKPLIKQLGATTIIVSHNLQELEIFDGEVMDFEGLV
ncbi:ATP-binding cassette domain-containing protein [Mucilaginibacter rubeus]|uniref:ATP-binding cassette domain-containing protein n=1 Tax=Mucilaginibacter rubeus TaxID=2027860 RepID=A0AAE6MKJ8_9SPHI|nr:MULTISPECIES: ATP-binding cassette domain-containing protein [Mucilaginibacter]QEM06858.1 ATP-binding cassette domain-containing protein [Mucilaginibacter rubeus]QEM19447.1 ATP-binding cassette domain-containing protein [Mucilaginibacter gossypii]QTE44006.1 ATP-binding cassette domain-containing protein [Mucilaginibacter rubeus]QTE50607.1 ATP-binding cassette domain-containing protein [Mucilaginibacter rubeus]QTE55692.1 ATP-binding cassette domain-containing protein [Mucilaginibacter rubeus